LKNLTPNRVLEPEHHKALAFVYNANSPRLSKVATDPQCHQQVLEQNFIFEVWQSIALNASSMYWSQTPFLKFGSPWPFTKIVMVPVFAVVKNVRPILNCVLEQQCHKARVKTPRGISFFKIQTVHSGHLNVFSMC